MSVIGLHDALAGVHPQPSRSQQIGSHGVGIAADDLRTILAHIDAQAAEIARLREAVERLDAGQNRGPVVTYKRGFGPCDGDNAILAQETQP